MTRRRALTLFSASWAGVGAAGRLSPVDEAGYRELLAAARGQLLLVDFWATWCQPCRVELPLLVKLAARLRGRGLKLVTISCDEPEQEADAARFLAQCGVSGPAYIKRAANDDRFIASVDANWSGALPALFLYDRQGRQARRWVGETALAAVEAAVGKLR